MWSMILCNFLLSIIWMFSLYLLLSVSTAFVLLIFFWYTSDVVVFAFLFILSVVLGGRCYFGWNLLFSIFLRPLSKKFLCLILPFPLLCFWMLFTIYSDFFALITILLVTSYYVLDFIYIYILVQLTLNYCYLLFHFSNWTIIEKLFPGKIKWLHNRKNCRVLVKKFHNYDVGLSHVILYMCSPQKQVYLKISTI